MRALQTGRQPMIFPQWGGLLSPPVPATAKHCLGMEDQPLWYCPFSFSPLSWQWWGCYGPDGKVHRQLRIQLLLPQIYGGSSLLLQWHYDGTLKGDRQLGQFLLWLVRPFRQIYPGEGPRELPGAPLSCCTQNGWFLRQAPKAVGRVPSPAHAFRLDQTLL